MASNGHASAVRAKGDLKEAESIIGGLLKDIGSQITRVPQDLGVLKGLVEAAFEGGLTDDRKFLLERIVQAVSSLPPGSATAASVTNILVTNLWDALLHPPISYLGDEFRYRTADGSNNNIMYPSLGKAGSAYARSVVPKKSLPQPLPDPGTIFDAVFARRGPQKDHPAKFSSLALALATIIIHDIFRTDDQDWNKTSSSAYLDLGPLYGNNAKQQATVRTFKNGMLKPDTFSEPRILGQPPGVAALLVCFGRFHNYVVEELAIINENNRFGLPVGKETDEAALLKRDNDLFQTGRLVTSGLYVNIILKDYVRVILNLNRSETKWTLDPRVTNFDVFDAVGTPKGIGNQVSLEFNLIYRWHATISDKNARWAEDFFKTALPPGSDLSTMSQEQFINGMKAWGHKLDADPGKWTFGSLTRGTSGSFDDGAIANLLTEETEDVAGAFGGRNIPAVMRAIDMLGIEQGRAWGTASLNELRAFFSLKPHKTFLDINSDPDIAASLEALYGHPDNVEMYPGLSAEEGKPLMSPGSGLCGGYTNSKAILSDAIALVRGDRFHAVDCSPANLTAFGYNEIQPDPEVGNGVSIRRLLSRALPGWYRGDSVYALFPLTIPPENKKIFKGFGTESLYSYDRPSFVPPPTPIKTWKANTDILNDQENFKVPWGKHIYDLLDREYMLGWDNERSVAQHKAVMKALYSPSTSSEQFRNFYQNTMAELIHQNSHKLRDSYLLDVVRDATNLSHAKFIAAIFHFPIKGPGVRNGITAQELFDMLRTLFAWVSLDLDSTKSFSLKMNAKKAAVELGKLYKPIVEAVRDERTHWLRELLGIGTEAMPDFGTELIRRLLEGGMSVDDVVWTVIPLAAETSFMGQGSAQMVDLFLSDEYKSHWPVIQALAQEGSPDAIATLRKYALESYRLTSPALTLRTVASPSISIMDGTTKLQLNKGDSIVMDFIAASLDPAKYPSPNEIQLDRPEGDYVVFGWGGHQCVGREIVVQGIIGQLIALSRLPGFRRAPGLAGMLKKKSVGGFRVYMDETWSDWTPYPPGLKVIFDGF